MSLVTIPKTYISVIFIYSQSRFVYKVHWFSHKCTKYSNETTFFGLKYLLIKKKRKGHFSKESNFMAYCNTVDLFIHWNYSIIMKHPYLQVIHFFNGWCVILMIPAPNEVSGTREGKSLSLPPFQWFSVCWQHHSFAHGVWQFATNKINILCSQSSQCKTMLANVQDSLIISEDWLVPHITLCSGGEPEHGLDFTSICSKDRILSVRG